jgi:C-terminal processing protease CtpA/Prc
MCRHDLSQTTDGRIEDAASPPSPPAPKELAHTHTNTSNECDRRNSASTRSSQPKPKGQSLGLMLEGTRVARVMRSSPAYNAGLQPEDLIKQVNGIRVSKDDVGKILRMQWLGGCEPLELVADRGNDTIRVVVQPDDVEISTPTKLRSKTDGDEALAWQLHHRENGLLTEAEEQSVVC